MTADCGNPNSPIQRIFGMQKQGTITRWDSTRAFGFIRSPGGTADVFFHLKDFRSATPPREGMAVVYDDDLLPALPAEPHDVAMTHALTPRAGLVTLGV